MQRFKAKRNSRHQPAWLIRSIICAGLLLFSLCHAMGQASNAIKSERLARYTSEFIGTKYDYLVGTYQKRNRQAVRVFLDSLHIRYRFPTDIHPTYLQDSEDEKASDMKLESQQAIFVLPGWPGERAWWRGASIPSFSSVNLFNLEKAILKIAKNPLVDDFLFQVEGRGWGPVTSAAYNLERSIAFSDTSNPTPKEALGYLNRVLEPFFQKYGGHLNIIQTGPDSFRFKLAVQDLHGAVLKDVKDAERLDGHVEVTPQFNRPAINIEVFFTGKYAPMPFNQPPPDARYVDLQDDDLDKFANELSAYLQSQHGVVPMEASQEGM